MFLPDDGRIKLLKHVVERCVNECSVQVLCLDNKSILITLLCYSVGGMWLAESFKFTAINLLTGSDNGICQIN